jgi:glutamate-1-semialdehyde 2,1-aminomutase
MFGPGAEDAGLPTRMLTAQGCRVWDEQGREYLDYVMALGAVALGYGHSGVTRAATKAVAAGVVGPLPPVLEEELAEALARRMPWLELMRFHKTGAEAVAAAVRLSRVATGRDQVLGCGYHGWLDWCQATGRGTPAATRVLFAELPFNDPERARRAIQERGDRLAAVVVEPLIAAEPSREWLDVLRAETARVGAVLVFDEIKTAFRLAIGGATERYGVHPDLVVLGKAMANGFPLAVVGGRADLMRGVARSWISSTLATESVSLAAALATLEAFEREDVCAYLNRIGTRLVKGLQRTQRAHPDVVTGIGGVAEMCYLHFASEPLARAVAAGCARRGLLFKRSAYNYVSLAHDEGTVDRALAVLGDAMREAARNL